MSGAEEFMREVILALGGSAAIDQERLTATAKLVKRLHTDGETGTFATGALLIALGVAQHLAPHPDSDALQQELGNDPREWKDATGRVWDLNKGFRDGHGAIWRYAGGFQAAPDTQPLLGSFQAGEDDVPLTYVQAATGGLDQA